MSARQPDLFYGDKRPPRQYADHQYRRPEKANAKPYAWVSMASWVRHIGHLLAIETASGDHYRRVRESARADGRAQARADDHVSKRILIVADNDRARTGAVCVEPSAGPAE